MITFMEGGGISNCELVTSSDLIEMNVVNNDNSQKLYNIPLASNEQVGLMSISDKLKLDSTPNIYIVSLEEYDAIENKNSNDLYFIKL